MLNRINTTWSLPRRLALIAIMSFLAVCPVFYQVASLDLGHLTGTYKEVDGLQYQRALFQVMTANGETQRTSSLSRFNDHAQKHDAEFSTTAHREAFVGAASDVERAQKGRDLMHEIAARSGLSLDPEAASYYLMNMISLRMPSIVVVAAQLQKEIGAAGNVSVFEPPVVQWLAVLNQQMQELRQTAKYLESTPEGAVVVKKLSTNLAPIWEIEQWLRANSGNAYALDTETVRKAIAPLPAAMNRFWEDGSAELLQLLNNRIATDWNHVIIDAAIVLILTAFAIALAIVVARSLSGSINEQISALERISKEDETAPIPCAGCANENGAIAAALQRLKEGVLERRRLAEETKRQAAEAERLNKYYADEHARFMTTFREASTNVANGNFAYRITTPVIDEYREIVVEMNNTAERLGVAQETLAASSKQRDTAVQALAHALSQLAAGDLRVRVDAAVGAEFERLKTDFNTAVNQLELTIAEVKAGTDSIKLGTDEISQASDDLSRRTENQAANLEQTAAAVAEITSTVAKTSENANHATGVVGEAKIDAEKSGAIVRKAIDAMSSIEKSSQQISQIIGVIDEIAFQTNLLALNAGVEAARAGDAGRGFAVVASEVRALAQRSAEAAKEIKGLISTSTSHVSQGVELVAETGRSLDRIVTSVGEINTVVASIASSAKEQALGLSQVNTAVSQMDQVTQQNAAMVEEATAATRTLQQQTDDLSAQVARFQTSSNPHQAALHDMGKRMKASASVPPARRKGLAKAAPARISSHGNTAVAVATDGWEEF